MGAVGLAVEWLISPHATTLSPFRLSCSFTGNAQTADYVQVLFAYLWLGYLCSNKDDKARSRSPYVGSHSPIISPQYCGSQLTRSPNLHSTHFTRTQFNMLVPWFAIECC